MNKMHVNVTELTISRDNFDELHYC